MSECTKRFVFASVFHTQSVCVLEYVMEIFYLRQYKSVVLLATFTTSILPTHRSTKATDRYEGEEHECSQILTVYDQTFQSSTL